MPLCFPIFSTKTMFGLWLPVSRVQRFAQLLWQGVFHCLFALLMVLLVRGLLSLLVWGFPDASRSDHAKGVLELPLQILLLCGLFALVAHFFIPPCARPLQR